jgi:outer membrane protein assembly factor BamA
MGNHGRPFASVSTAVVPDTARPQHLAVRFSVDPDQPCRFSTPQITGTLKTKRRQLDQDIRIRPGAPFNIDKIERTRNLLLSREYIAEVTVGAPRIVNSSSVAVAAPATADTASVQMPIAVTDRSGMGLDGALALSNDQTGGTRLTGALDFSLLNLAGWGEKALLSFKGDQSSERLDIALSKVHWFEHPITVGGNFGLEIQTNEYGHLAGGLELLYEIRPRWQTGLGLKGEETTVSTGKGETRQFGGSNFILERTAEAATRGNGSREFSLVTGIGLADRPDRTYTRWHLDFSTGGEMPFLRSQAIGARFTALNLFTNEDSLARVELYRLGGYRTVRGYDNEQFAFRNAAYAQLEYLAYFSAAGAVYLLCDGGVGFPHGLAIAAPSHDYVRMLGYGLGLRVPARIGTLSIEWARNIDDTRSLGRVNVRVQNSLTSETVGRN